MSAHAIAPMKPSWCSLRAIAVTFADLTAK
jgi:hypothetical protein